MARDGAAFAIQDYPLGPMLNQCCGGRVRLLIERLGPEDIGWLTAASAEEAGWLTHGDRGRPRRPPRGGRGRPSPPLKARGDKPGPTEAIVEPLGGARPALLLFGAGHVGKAAAPILASLPFRLSWMDAREEPGPRPCRTIR